VIQAQRYELSLLYVLRCLNLCNGIELIAVIFDHIWLTLQQHSMTVTLEQQHHEQQQKQQQW
jgi:hypothetical protein